MCIYLKCVVSNGARCIVESVQMFSRSINLFFSFLVFALDRIYLNLNYSKCIINMYVLRFTIFCSDLTQVQFSRGQLYNSLEVNYTILSRSTISLSTSPGLYYLLLLNLWTFINLSTLWQMENYGISNTRKNQIFLDFCSDVIDGWNTVLFRNWFLGCTLSTLSTFLHVHLIFVIGSTTLYL